MAETSDTQKNNAEKVSPSNRIPVREAVGQLGVSDERRAELARMEQEAGVQHEARDEGVPQQPASDPESSAEISEE